MGEGGSGRASVQHTRFTSLGDVSSASFSWSATLPVTGFLFFTCFFSIGSLRKWSHRKRIVCLLWTMGDSFVCLCIYLLYCYLQVGWAICWYLSSCFGWFYHQNIFHLFYCPSSCAFKQLQRYCHYWKWDQSKDTFRCLDFLVLFGHSSLPASTSCKAAIFNHSSSLWRKAVLCSKYCLNWLVSDSVGVSSFLLSTCMPQAAKNHGINVWHKKVPLGFLSQD